MVELTYKQKIAMMRILLDLILADNRVDEREKLLFTQISNDLKLPKEVHFEVREKNLLMALKEVKEFPRDAKELLASLMGKMIIVDEDINYNEVCLYNVVNDFCEINIEFQIEDYPQYNRS